jgi:hypothetical protein
MAHNAYIILDNSNSSLTKWFRVIYEGRRITRSKAANVEYTIGGAPDISMGEVQEVHTYIIRVRQGGETGSWGVLSDLETFYSYNNPNGTPSNLITMTDHYQQDKDVYMIGEFSENVMGIEIEGANGWFLVEVTFHVKP